MPNKSKPIHATNIKQRLFSGSVLNAINSTNDSMRSMTPQPEEPSSAAVSSKRYYPPIEASPEPSKQDTPKSLLITDNRRVRATSGLKMNPERDYKTGIYPTKPMVEIASFAKRNGEDPWTPLAIAAIESKMGQTDDNLGHILDGSKDASSPAQDLVLTIRDKRKYAKSLGYNDEAHQIQAYNGLGKLTATTDQAYNIQTGQGSSQKSWYGVPVPPGGSIDMKKNPLYAKEVIDIRDNVLKRNKDIQNLVDSAGTNGAIISETPYGYINNKPKNLKAKAFVDWANRQKE